MRPFDPALHPRGHHGLFVTKPGAGRGLLADPHGTVARRPAGAKKRQHAVVPQSKFGAARKGTGPGFGGTLQATPTRMKKMVGD